MRVKGEVQAFAIGLAVVAAFASSAAGDPVHSQFLTPTYLMENALFPSRPPELIDGGETLHFGYGADQPHEGQSEQVLLEYPLPWGFEPKAILIRIDADPHLPALWGSDPWDNDLMVGITDGTNIVAFQRANNDNGTGNLVDGDRVDDHMGNRRFTFLFSNAGMPDLFSALFELEDAATTVTGTIGSQTATAVSPRWISSASDLSLVVVAQDPSEQYNISSIYLEVIPIPAPGAAVLGLIGVGMVGWLRRRLAR